MATCGQYNPVHGSQHAGQQYVPINGSHATQQYEPIYGSQPAVQQYGPNHESQPAVQQHDPNQYEQVNEYQRSVQKYDPNHRSQPTVQQYKPIHGTPSTQHDSVYGSHSGSQRVQQYDPIHGSKTAMQHEGQLVNGEGGHGIYKRHEVVNDEGGQGIYKGHTAGQADAGEPAEEDHGCFRVVRTSKHMKIPCTRNEYRRYKVRVPKQVHERVPKRVQYTAYETRERTEPYTVKRHETAYRFEDQPYTVKVPKKVTKMVRVTKKVPKTIYVNVFSEVPHEETIMIPETRTRRIKVPYKKEVLDQQYRKVKEKVPVTRYRMEYDTVAKTVYEDSWRTKCVPVTKVVHKEIPVFRVITKSPGEGGYCDQIDGPPTSYHDKVPVDHAEPTIAKHPEPTDNVYRESPVRKHPEPTYEPAPHYEPHPEPSPVIRQHELTPVLRQSEQSAVVRPLRQREPTRVLHQSEPTAVMHAAEPHYEPNTDKWVQTEYSAPKRYDFNNDGVLDASEREVARLEGNLHVNRIAIIDDPKQGGAVVEELFSQPPLPNRQRKRTGRRGKRTSRR